MTLEPALDKEEMKEVFETVISRLEDGIIKSLPLTFKKHLNDAKSRPLNLLSDDAVHKLNQSLIEIKDKARAIPVADEKWEVQTPNFSLMVEERDNRILVFYDYNLMKMKDIDLEEIKGMMVEEIVRKDSTLVFKKRDGLIITADSTDEINVELGDRRARHKRHKRLKKYKDRIDDLMGDANLGEKYG